MVAIISSPSETCCYKCLIELESECLKCSHCSSSIHFRCSDLPVYALLRLKTSQASYVCRTCVFGSVDQENIKSQEALVRSILEKEEKTVKYATIESDRSDNGIEVNDSSDPVITTEQMPVEQKIDKAKPTCKYYMQKSCRFGRKGVGCKFSHPREPIYLSRETFFRGEQQFCCSSINENRV